VKVTWRNESTVNLFDRLIRSLIWVLGLCHMGQSFAGALGDRVVLTINNVPFTQRQVEGYIDVKECLRKAEGGAVRIVTANNWEDALTVFTNDAVILLEAQRLGGISVPDALARKYLDLVKSKMSQNQDLKQAFERLGLADGGLERAVDTVLRVASFRRSKEREETQSQLQLSGVSGAEVASRSSAWHKDLIDRAIVRRYEGANHYILIRPALGG
jgi:hypothetical protein